jgi:methyl-accepting chemotaxis protein
MLAALLSFLLDEIGQLIRYLRQRAHDRHVHDVQSAIELLSQTQGRLADVSHEDVHAHQCLAHATNSLTKAQKSLIEQMALNGDGTEHLAQAIERLASVLERIADHLATARIVDAVPPHHLSEMARRHAD